MIVAATISLFVGFVLLYAGIKGIHYRDPWNLVAQWMKVGGVQIGGGTNG